MRYPIRTTALVVTAVVFLTGCSTIQQFQLLLTVVDKEDGQPVPGAQVTVDTYGKEDRKDDVDYGWPHDVRTDFDGGFDLPFSVSPYPDDFHDHWFLKVSKPGFEPVVMDIKPDPLPERANETIVIRLRVEMQRNTGPNLPPAIRRTPERRRPELNDVLDVRRSPKPYLFTSD